MNEQYVNEQVALNDFNENRNITDGFDRWLLDDKEELRDLQASLTGTVWSEEEQKFVDVKDMEALMNMKGSQMLCWSYLAPLIKNAKVTFFDREQIKQLMYSNGKSLLRHLHYNNNKYELSQYNVEIVYRMVMTYLFSVFNRSLLGKERDRLTQAHQFVTREVNNVNNVRDDYPMPSEYSQKKKKFLGVF